MQDAEESGLPDSGLPDSEDNSLQENNEPCAQDTRDSVATEEDTENRVYLDLIPVRSFLHTSGGRKSPSATDRSHSPGSVEDQKDPPSETKEVLNRDYSH